MNANFAALIVLSASALYSATPPVRQIPTGEKAKVTGTIVSRRGDIVVVQEKSGDVVYLDLFEDTKIERVKGGLDFFRHPRMDITAMLPGLKIQAEGVGDSKGQLDTRKITFKPDVFAIEIAAGQQIAANEAAAERAQTTASQGLRTADAARSLAREAQSTADSGLKTANTAEDGAKEARAAANLAISDAQSVEDLGIFDAEALAMLNKRVSELDDYETIAEAAIFFGNGEAQLDVAAKKLLGQLADIATPLDGYMIEITGYASSPGSRKLNQNLSQERAAAVADYLREAKDIPVRRILAPAGFGATHVWATANDPGDKALDRRVDVKVLVNKALSPQ